MQEAPDVNALTEDLRERWAQLAGSRSQLQSAEQTQTPADYRQAARRLLMTLRDSQWTRGVEGSEVGRQHVFSAVETVQRRRRNAPWSQRAAGKTTGTSLSASVRLSGEKAASAARTASLQARVVW